MKKVINITLGGIVFAIEQDAYDALSLYLEQIQTTLSGDDSAEVLSDIEGAIAEKFLAANRSEKLAVTSDDVERVMAEMGSPSAFGEGEDASEATEAPSSTDTSQSESKKRLYRDEDSSIIAGVASGLAQYFDIDPVIVRLIFVISFFFNGLGLLAYIILWLVVPTAKTTADKYAMRGERVTLKDISDRVKSGVEHIDVLDNETTRGAWDNLRRFLDKLFQLLGAVVKVLVKIAQFVVGLFLVIGGALGIAAMVATYSVILLSDKVFFPNDVQIALDTLQGTFGGIIAMASSFVMMAIPLLILIISGASLLAKRNFFTTPKSVTLAVIWIVAAVLAGTTSVLQVEQVMQKIGPVEGQFSEDSFHIQWDNGAIYGDDNQVRVIQRETPPEAPLAPTTTTNSDTE